MDPIHQPILTRRSSLLLLPPSAKRREDITELLQRFLRPHNDTSNGEVEGPGEASGRTRVELSSSGAPYAAGRATRAHTVSKRPRRQADHASRTPPTIVRW